jgi:hypothetical protein
MRRKVSRTEVLGKYFLGIQELPSALVVNASRSRWKDPQDIRVPTRFGAGGRVMEGIDGSFLPYFMTCGTI